MIYVTTMIFLKDGKETTFHEYEYSVLPILKNYDAKLIYRIRPNEETIICNTEEVPYEIHFLSFPNEEAFIAYGNDEKRQKFMHLREASIQSIFLAKGGQHIQLAPEILEKNHC